MKGIKPVNLGKAFFIFFIFIFLLNSVFSKLGPEYIYSKHYYFLSRSLLHGKFDVTDELKSNFGTAERELLFDYAYFQEKYFVYLGIFPALFGILLLPLGPENYFRAMPIFFLILILIFLAKLTVYFLKKEEGFLTSLFLLVSSPVLTAIIFRGPWYLNALIVVCFGLVFLWFYEVKKKAWAIYFLIPLFLTRPTTVFYFFLPLFNFFTSPQRRKKEVSFFLISAGIAFLIFVSYNYARFGHSLETGYRYFWRSKINQSEFINYRLKETSFKDYFLSNASYLLLNPPRPIIDQALRYTPPYFKLSRYGVGLLFVIPWFLPYLLLNQKKRQDWPHWLVIGAILLAILNFGGEGTGQIGSRYSCDFLPLIIFLNLRWLKENKPQIPLFQKLLLIGFVLNFYFYFLVLGGYLEYP